MSETKADLLERIKKLEAERDKWKSEFEVMQKSWHRMADERDAALARIKELEANPTEDLVAKNEHYMWQKTQELERKGEL